MTPGSLAVIQYVPVPPQLTISTGSPAVRQRSAVSVSAPTASVIAARLTSACMLARRPPSQPMTPAKRSAGDDAA